MDERAWFRNISLARCNDKATYQLHSTLWAFFVPWKHHSNNLNMSPLRENDEMQAMQHALQLAKKSPPKPTNFRVGAVLIKLDDWQVAAEGYTLEIEGNTHAEECCLLKLAEQHTTSEDHLAESITSPHVLFTTLEPCYKRLSGKLPCVERIIRQKSWIKKVYIGVQEPETFVGQNPGRQILEDAGIEVIHVAGIESEILSVATAGHVSAA
jgi:pyrimidine deaminase RibD-like protein